MIFWSDNYGRCKLHKWRRHYPWIPQPYWHPDFTCTTFTFKQNLNQCSATATPKLQLSYSLPSSPFHVCPARRSASLRRQVSEQVVLEQKQNSTKYLHLPGSSNMRQPISNNTTISETVKTRPSDTTPRITGKVQTYNCVYIPTSVFLANVHTSTQKDNIPIKRWHSE